MQDHRSPTTPFGRRSLTLAMVEAQAIAKACPDDAVVHKWKTFRAIRDAKDLLGVSDRALTVLNALLTCVPDTVLTPGGDLVVFPSNVALSERTHGMADTTLRRHLAALVGAGIIIRKDSPNGKRYARRGRDGGVELAFGFDLTPVVARASEFERLAEKVEQERRVAILARERITLFRRDIAKMIAIGTEEGVGGDWAQMQARFRALSYRLPRSITPALVEPLAQQLENLALEVGNLLDSYVSVQKQDGNDNHFGAHYQNSNTDLPIESEPAKQESREPVSPPAEANRPRQVAFPLGLVLKACPDITMYTREGITNWRDLIATASLVRGALGVSPSAWEAAVSAMGEVDAAITVASILQRSEEIKSPGGYLRGLTAKASAGQYSIGPIIMSLLRRQTLGATQPGGGVSSAS